MANARPANATIKLLLFILLLTFLELCFVFQDSLPTEQPSPADLGFDPPLHNSGATPAASLGAAWSAPRLAEGLGYRFAEFLPPAGAHRFTTRQKRIMSLYLADYGLTISPNEATSRRRA
jgi:hypothetical protein